MRENDSQGDNAGKMEVVDLIIHCLREHENKFSELLGRLEQIDDVFDADKLKNYGTICLKDKRDPHALNCGQVIKTCVGVNGLEMSTDRGYTICFSDSDIPFEE
jgi:hypothetical protein